MRDSVSERFEALFGPEFGHGKPFDLNLLRNALEALGSPQRALPPVIHVAGTNGKGSTIAFMSAIAEGAGLKVHAFTKPHLIKRWLTGPDGWSLPVCEVDLKVGGGLRYVWRHSDGTSMGLSGTFREISSFSLYLPLMYRSISIGTSVR